LTQTLPTFAVFRVIGAKLNLTSSSNPTLEDKRWKLACWGVFLLILGLYCFSSPARIDILDGQMRFEVSKNLLDLSGPDMKDYFLIQGGIPVNASTGRSYSFYTSAPSLLPLPFMFLSRLVNGPKIAADRGAFVLANAFYGACIAPLMVMFYRRMKVNLRSAVLWTLAFCLTTLWWNGSATSFDQCQHGLILMAIMLVAFDAASSRSLKHALWVGLLGGVLLNCRAPFVTLMPIVPIFWWWTWRGEKLDQTLIRPVLLKMTAMMIVGLTIGVAGYLFYNYIRFDSFSMPKYANVVPVVGNPISGFLTLLISPGKGFLWFSPTLVFALLGYRYIPSEFGALKRSLTILCLLHLGEMSCLAFASGDWCWGPRYLLPIMPLMALASPYMRFRAKSFWVPALITAGLVIQCMGLAIENHRFFYTHRLAPTFWTESWVYFRMSQLADRPNEILESITSRNVDRPKINSNTLNEATYAPFGPPGKPKPRTSRKSKKATSSPTSFSRLLAQAGTISANRKGVDLKPVDPREWQKQYRIFYLPKPWWGWIQSVPADQRPFSAALFGTITLMLTLFGCGLIGKVFRNETT